MKKISEDVNQINGDVLTLPQENDLSADDIINNLGT